MDIKDEGEDESKEVSIPTNVAKTPRDQIWECFCKV